MILYVDKSGSRDHRAGISLSLLEICAVPNVLLIQTVTDANLLHICVLKHFYTIVNILYIHYSTYPN